MKIRKRVPSADAQLIAKVMEESANKIYYALDRNTAAIEGLAIALRDQLPWWIEQVGVLRNIRHESEQISRAIYGVTEQLRRKPSFFQSVINWWEMRRFNRSAKKQSEDWRKTVDANKQTLDEQAKRNDRWS